MVLIYRSVARASQLRMGLPSARAMQQIRIACAIDNPLLSLTLEQRVVRSQNLLRWKDLSGKKMHISNGLSHD
jgi:hypothetical protein